MDHRPAEDRNVSDRSGGMRALRATRLTLTVIDPLGAPYIAEEPIWSCGPLPDDSVQCDQTSAAVASMLNIVPSHVLYRLDFDDGKACIFHFGDI